MQYFASLFSYGEQTERKELSEEQKEFVVKLKTTKGLFQYFQDEFIEDVLCAQVQDVEFSSLSAKNGAIKGLEKKALFINSNITFRVLDQETKDGGQTCVPVVHFENIDFDENQEQEEEKFIPISSDLKFLTYQDKDEGKMALIFFYSDSGQAYMVESDDSVQQQVDSLNFLTGIICRMMYVLHEYKDPKDAGEQAIAKYCIQVNKDSLYSCKSIYELTGGKQNKKKNVEESKESYSDVADATKNNDRQIQEAILQKEFEGIQIDDKHSDTVSCDQLKFSIAQRVLQVHGHLFRFEGNLQQNFLVAQDCFLCIDRLATDKSHSYMFNVTDQQQKLSFTRIHIQKEPQLNYSFSEVDRMLMWMGYPVEGAQQQQADVPCYTFFLQNEADCDGLKASLAKVIFETNMQIEFDKENDKEDQVYVASQIIGDQDKNADMEGIEQIEDFEFLDFDVSQLDDSWVEPQPYIEKDKKENEDDASEEENPEDKQQRSNPFGLGFTNEPVVPDQDEEDQYNTCQLQAYTYDRSFVASGSVVKVYEPYDENDVENKHAIKHSFTIDGIKNDQGDNIRPMSMMLHNSENRLIFSDANDTTQLFDYDLETGKIVEQFQASDQKEFTKINHLSTTIRNGQTDASAELIGIGDRAIFTLDTRINNKIKKAQEKLYKTNPMFNQVAATFKGGLAIGSLDGSVRLYKQVGQNAKTLLPGLGDPIKGIDMSSDAKWVIATTQTYLLLIPTEFGEGKSGFENPMGKNKPTPKKLQIHCKDLAKHRINFVDFTPARFNNFNVSSMEETSIVTATGPFVITWNFKKVLKGLLKSYQIQNTTQFRGKQKQSTNVIDSQFKFNTDESIFVTDPKNIGVQRRTKKTMIQY